MLFELETELQERDSKDSILKIPEINFQNSHLNQYLSGLAKKHTVLFIQKIKMQSKALCSAGAWGLFLNISYGLWHTDLTEEEW